MTEAKNLMLHVAVLDIGIDYADAGQWRSYGFETFGMNKKELLDNCTVFETDQDGGELNSYSLDKASNPVYDQVKRILQKKMERAIVEHVIWDT